MKKVILAILLISFLLIGCDSEEQQQNGVVFQSEGLVNEDFDTLEELISASDYIVEATALDHPNLYIQGEDAYSINTIQIEDIIVNSSDSEEDSELPEEIRLLQLGDFRDDAHIIDSNQKYVMFITEHEDDSVVEGAYRIIGNWQGLYEITEDDEIRFFANEDNIKEYQESLAELTYEEFINEINNPGSNE